MLLVSGKLCVRVDDLPHAVPKQVAQLRAPVPTLGHSGVPLPQRELLPVLDGLELRLGRLDGVGLQKGGELLLLAL